jgi:transposase-like protein
MSLPRWFSPPMCRAIKSLYSDGLSVKNISERLNIKYNQIYRFIKVMNGGSTTRQRKH